LKERAKRRGCINQFGKVFVKIGMKRFNGRRSLNPIKKSSDQKEFNSVFEIKIIQD
jgi:hypothetical protein